MVKLKVLSPLLQIVINVMKLMRKYDETGDAKPLLIDKCVTSERGTLSLISRWRYG